MNGAVVFRQALSLLNYTDSDGVPGGTALYRRALPLLNQIAADLWYMANDTPFCPLSSLADELPLPEAVVLGIVPFGLAMLIAQTEGDADNQTLFAAQYDQRRSGAGAGARIRDRLPRCEG